MQDLKTFKELYRDLLKISQVDTCSCNKNRDKQLARLLIDFKINTEGIITPEQKNYITEFPIINYYTLGRNLLTDKTLEVNEKYTLRKNFFKTDNNSKSVIRRLELQLKGE